jgi:hypothetical protein
MTLWTAKLYNGTILFPPAGVELDPVAADVLEWFESLDFLLVLRTRVETVVAVVGPSVDKPSGEST